MSQPPDHPKLYHILHVDRLPSIVAGDRLLCDALMLDRQGTGTTIGMGKIKQRRLNLRVETHPGLMVGACVPFYFCPRSVMLYLIHQANHADLAYRGGQGPIVHLELDLRRVVKWAEKHGLRWTFTLSNAGSFYFEERTASDDLGDINWEAVWVRHWAGPLMDGKQAEFLVEREVAWKLVSRIGVHSNAVGQRALRAIAGASHQPPVEVISDWYY